jgi:dimethylargininase
VRVAITRAISAAIGQCELTHLHRQPIDLGKARAQHDAYERRLHEAGCAVVRLSADDTLPDSVFVEDTALVFDEVALVTRPGALSRRGETTAVAEALSAYRPVRQIDPPATIDGGDVLVMHKRVFVGESQRTSRSAIEQLAQILGPWGYVVEPVRVTGCLHLKSAVTVLSDEALVINRAWVPAVQFQAYQLVDVDPAEPFGANALRIGDSAIYPAAYPRTRARLEALGVPVVDVDVSELIKAEGAVTCCSLVFATHPNVTSSAVSKRQLGSFPKRNPL